MGDNLIPNLGARKRDHKIYITDEAIEKVPYIEYQSIDRKHYDIIRRVIREALRIAKEKNDSNEISIIYSLEWEKLQEKGQEFMGISIGDEHSVNPTESTVAYHLVNSTLNCVIICVHNHPNLSKISLDDVKFFLRHESIKMLVAVTNLGSIFYMAKKDDFDWDIAAELFEEAISIHNLKPGDIKNAQKAADYFVNNCYKAGIAYSDR